MTPPLAQPEETAALTQRAQTLVDLGRPADALPLLHRALGQDPENDEALCLLSLAHWNMGAQDEALAWAERAVAARPDGLWAHQLLACHLLNMGWSQRSVAAAQEAVRLGPENAKGLKILGRALLASGTVADSLATAQRMLALAPDSELTHELLTLIAVHEHRWADVETHCRDALAIQPTSYISLSYLGQALDKQTPSRGLIRDPGRLPEAIECLGRATQIDPVDTMARQSLAAALHRYLLCDAVESSKLAAVILLSLAALRVFSASSPLHAYWFMWLVGGVMVALCLTALTVRRRRLRALPPFVQQSWRQHRERCVKGEGPFWRRP